MEETVLGLIPYLVVSDAKAAIEFYKQALDGKEIARHAAPNSEKLMHARVEIHGSTLMFSDDFPEFMGGKSRTPQALGGTPVTLHLQVEDAQSVWDKAIAAGVTVTMPLKEQFWGDIYGKFVDPFGHEWAIGQSVKRPSQSELQEGAEVEFGKAEALKK
jgi:PhnB protein